MRFLDNISLAWASNTKFDLRNASIVKSLISNGSCCINLVVMTKRGGEAECTWQHSRVSVQTTKYSVKALDSVYLSERLSDLQIIYTKGKGFRGILRSLPRPLVFGNTKGKM